MSTSRFEDVSRKVRAFYEECSFPGYEGCETPFDLMEKAGRGMYAKLLDEQLPLGVRILDAGCGTGQLVVFLSMMNRQVIGIDFSYSSLRKGHGFKEKFNLRGAHFLQMDLFHPGMKEASFDYVFCNGVLHHTADAYGGFQSLCRLVKKGGYIIIGLYNRYGRLLLDLRRFIFRFTKERFLWLDFFMRQESMEAGKKRIWFMDQYRNPHEEKFAVGDVLGWFHHNDIEYMNSIPKINIGERLTSGERLFERHHPGTTLDHLLSQLWWIFTKGREGGFFILIGKKA